eukprot:scpid100107/ scgid1272/ 
MDMWGRLNKGLQVVQNQLDTYVEAAGVATPDEGATDSTATSGSAAAPDDVQQEKAQGATPEKTGRFEDLQEALEQSENRNRLINEEFSLLLRQKDVRGRCILFRLLCAGPSYASIIHTANSTPTFQLPALYAAMMAKNSHQFLIMARFEQNKW